MNLEQLGQSTRMNLLLFYGRPMRKRVEGACVAKMLKIEIML